jgi:hypothetical protein
MITSTLLEIVLGVQAIITIPTTDVLFSGNLVKTKEKYNHMIKKHIDFEKTSCEQMRFSISIENMLTVI